MTMFFVLLGVAELTANLMKLVTRLDSPHTAPRRTPRRAANMSGENMTEFARAELELESALFAA